MIVLSSFAFAENIAHGDNWTESGNSGGRPANRLFDGMYAAGDYSSYSWNANAADNVWVGIRFNMSYTINKTTIFQSSYGSSSDFHFDRYNISISTVNESCDGTPSDGDCNWQTIVVNNSMSLTNLANHTIEFTKVQAYRILLQAHLYTGASWIIIPELMVFNTTTPSSPPSIQFINQTPLSSQSFWTTNVTFSSYWNFTYSTNCSIYINNTPNQSSTNHSAGITSVNYTINFDRNQEGQYTYFFSCQDNTTLINSTSTIFYVNRTHLTAIDYYNNSANISNFSIIVGSSNYDTTDGIIRLIPNGLQNITFSSNQSGGYLNRTYSNWNTSLNLTAQLWQYELHLNVIDAISGSAVPSFIVFAPLMNFTGTNGLATVYLSYSVSNYTLNLTASNYANANLSVNATPMTTESRSLTMNPYMNITILVEKTNAAFNTSLPNSTKFIVYCADTSVEYEFNKTATPNNQLYVPVTCPWEFLSLYVDYGTSTYYRTLIPGYNERSVTFYAIDLNNDLAYQILLKINDLTGEFTDGTAVLRKYIGGSSVTIIEQDFDIENKVVLYLIKDGLYTLSVRSKAGVERSLGYLVADSAGTKTITIPEISFVPDAFIGDKISWTWDSLNSTAIRLIYSDTSTQRTTNITFTVYNGTNLNHTIYSTYSENVSSATFTYLTNGNFSYLACFEAEHPSITEDIGECKIFSQEGIMGSWDGFEDNDRISITNWFAALFLVFLLLCFKNYIAVGLGIDAFLMFMFMQWKWLDLGNAWINYTVLSLTVLIAVLVYYMEGHRK